MKEYRRFSRCLDGAMFAAFVRAISKPGKKVEVGVQLIPKGTAVPTEDGGTRYYTSDGVDVTLFVGEEILAPVLHVELKENLG